MSLWKTIGRRFRRTNLPPCTRATHAWEQPTETESRAFVGRFVSQQQEQPRTKFQFAIVLPAEGLLIGNCGLRICNSALREGNIGYELDSRYWGQGYATEAAREMLRLGFEDHNLHRIEAGCVADNGGSARVLEKIGMKREGHWREKEFFKGRWWDSLLYAILDREWQAQNSPLKEGSMNELEAVNLVSEAFYVQPNLTIVLGSTPNGEQRIK